jgi:hypothetical protein
MLLPIILSRSISGLLPTVVTKLRSNFVKSRTFAIRGGVACLGVVHHGQVYNLVWCGEGYMGGEGRNLANAEEHQH